MARPSMKAASCGAVLTVLSLALAVAACASEPTANEGGADPAVAPPAEPPQLPAPLAALLGPFLNEPLTVDPLLAANADRACRASMVPFPAGVAPVIVDARGLGVLQLAYHGPGGAAAVCVDMSIARDGTVEALGGGSTTNGGNERPPIGDLELFVTDSMGSGRPPNVTSSLVIGRAGRGIARVAVDLPGRAPLIASTGNGWFAVWLPEAWPKGARVVGLDADGAVVAFADVP